MSRLLVDTSAYSAWARGYGPIQASMQGASGLYLSVIVLGELLAGFAAGSRRRQNEEYLRSFASSPRVEVLHIDEETARAYASIQHELRRRGTPVSPNDLWIAATAYQNGLRVLTLDRDFLKIPHVIVDLIGAPGEAE
jgi:tRNA(fMet)-specific endonuclease VapC